MWCRLTTQSVGEEYQYQPLENGGGPLHVGAARGPQEGVAGPSHSNGPSVGYPGSLGVPRYLQGSGSVARGQGPLAAGMPQLQPLGIEGVQDPLGRSGAGPRLRDAWAPGPSRELASFESPEPSPRVHFQPLDPRHRLCHHMSMDRCSFFFFLLVGVLVCFVFPPREMNGMAALDGVRISASGKE